MSNIYTSSNRKDENGEISYTFTCDGEHWKSSQKKSLDYLSKNINIPGFRKGKVPADLIKASISQNDIFERAANIQINAVLRDFSNTSEDDIIFDQPSVEITDISENKIIFTAAFKKNPEVTIGDYKNLDLQLMDTNVSDAEVDAEFNRMVKRDTMLSPSEDKVKNGDSVNIDFTGFEGDVKFDGGSATNQELIIGSHSFIDGFEEQIIGMNVGDVKDIHVTFPKDYHAENLAGKEVRFEIKVNAVYKVEYPEFNEEYFKKFKLDNVKTKDQFIAYLRNQLVEWKQYKAEQEFQKTFAYKVDSIINISFIPESLLNMEIKKIDKETANLAEKEKISKQQYLDRIGYHDNETYQEGLKVSAEKNIKLVFAIEKIAKELDIKVSESDIEEYFTKVSKLYNQTIENVKEQYKNNMANVEGFIFQKKVFDKLYKVYQEKK